MKQLFLTTLVLVSSLVLSGQEKWMKEGVKMDPPVCYASGKVEISRIPPPEAYLRQLKSAQEKTSNIIVDYINFPDSVIPAFEKAVEIWEYLLDSPVPIHMRASFAKLKNNVLGSCGPWSYYKDFDGAPSANTFYPVAIVEKILEREITGSSDPDFEAQFNQDVDWYFGVDQNTPPNQYDFVSIVLHEIAHGLGYTGFFYANESDAGYGHGDSSPASFDEYIHNYNSQQLTDTALFTNPSSQILTQLTSGFLQFISPIFNDTVPGDLPRLYAPRTFSDGSSVYHLNDNTYPSGNENSLMTHSSGMGESNFNPGPLTMNMLADIGWKHIYIKHEELKDVEELTGPVFIEAKIRSDFLLDTSSIFLYYSSDLFQTTDSLPFPFIKEAGLFKTVLPVNVQQGVVSYYISATDEKNRTFKRPSGAPETFYNFRIGPDTINPTIIHQPISQILTSETEVGISLKADDNLGIDTLIVEYFINKVPYQPIGLKNDSSTNYSGKFLFAENDLHDGDSVQYRILAKDASSNQNITYLPETGYFNVPVFSIFDPVAFYINDFNNLSQDFISSDFSIGTVSGFTDRAIHSRHPYPSPDTDDATYNFTTILKYPIVIADGGAMSFDEVVLVEPGSTGSLFDSEDFFDYVIVEGSKDQGISWQPLIDGYDSRANDNWLEEYNKGVVGNNSSTAGSKELMVTRNIDLTASGNFTVGDTILIRFRLFSDPYAHGWGWVIDNLSIQVAVPNSLVHALSPGNISVYPNPFRDRVNVAIQTEKPLKSLNVNVYNLYGQLIDATEEYNITSQYKKSINMDGYPAGVYLVVVKAEGIPVLSKKIIKN